MPELPEVETVRRSLEALVVDKTIEDVTVNLPRMIRTPDDVESFRHMLRGQRIERVGRRGKFLLIELGFYTLVSHLRMEGRYGLYRTEEPVEKHTHVIFHFTDGTELRYRDVRQFGTFDLLPNGELSAVPGLRKMGPEPLEPDFTPETLRQGLRKRTGKIKTLLLDQNLVAGIGNIYADEALFEAGIHPECIGRKLTKEECKRLHKAIVDVLTASVELGGSSIKSYVSGRGQPGEFQFRLKVYGKDKSPCPSCGTVIEKIRVGGRGTHFCPHCQPKKQSRKQA
ncbi:DNA-formamidopyrimidine glycosylase [Effusibacillus lacus]|uniref:Formamidopyrimidine-DNA glycosylase n=1 Tax=Effusibacillus lacus TaxID=1348429 RepID=A0A292YK06_9BACL|nr:DNA-formamidopyrimidine glycosylase [Effusibacillus lacus]TCS73612.1 DNA-(apurinic or apyrimidinic site) lyase [Effusibacillus lacus]GAX89496.1 DNA-formamidopyrimidine glycosylase [Effusibacillus lacus]